MEPDASFEARCPLREMFCFKIRAIRRCVQLVWEYRIDFLVCLDIPDPCMSAHGERICKCSCLCVCVCVCLSVPGSTNQSLGLKRTCQARRLSVATWPVWCSSVRVDVLALLTVWPCTAWWLLCIPCVYTTWCVCSVPRAVTLHTHGVCMFGMFITIRCGSSSERVFSVVCCEAEVSATGRSLVQRSPAECDQVRQ